MSTDANTSAAPAPSSPALPAPKWRLNLALFVLTLGAVFATGVLTYSQEKLKDFTTALLSLPRLMSDHATAVSALQFVGTVMTILVAHEFGHYITARIHKVDASLPFFIPMPFLSPFGTMGAVIRMRGTIPTRNALLDIGASGPLAGMCFAIPLYIYGVAHSQIVPDSGEGMAELGESLLVRGIDHLVAPTLPDGMTILYSPIAFAAWGGMFVTMINLLPVGQLDGGHVAYALFGKRQNDFAVTVQRAMLVFFGVIVAGHEMRDISSGRGVTVALISAHVANALFWLVWFQVLGILGTLATPAPRDDDEDPEKPRPLDIRVRIFALLGLVTLASIGREHPSLMLLIPFFGGLALLIAMEIKAGVFRKHELLNHPPTGDAPLSTGRKVIAIATLALFALLFMPEPFSF